MARARRSVRRHRSGLRVIYVKPARDFEDAASRRVLDLFTARMRAEIRAEARAAADEIFDQMLKQQQEP